MELGWRFSDLRSAGGDHEVDLIADLPESGFIAFEMKLSPAVQPADAKQLAFLRDQAGDAFRAGLVVHPGTASYQLSDRIAAVPLGVLV